MKTNLFFRTIFVLTSTIIFAQDKTTVTANNSDISDNLDLRAIATLFGDSKNLEDFERKLNDPNSQISNLDLNNDNQVDYLRVVENIENKQHIIVLQSVIGKDLYQDVASIEVERDGNNKVYVQIVGDTYIYGSNYIYEPVYVHTPIIYSIFWASYYNPYCSSWYWGYYPTYFYYWSPFPIFRYRNHIHAHINFGYTFNYVSYRRCHTGYYAYYGRRGCAWENRNPNYAFNNRNRGYSNRYEMDQHRTIKTRAAGTNQLETQPRNGLANTESVPRPRATNNDEVAVSPRNNPRSTSNNEAVVPPRNNPRSASDNEVVVSPRNNPRSTNNNEVVVSPRNNPRSTNNNEVVVSPRNNPRSTNNNEVVVSPRNNPRNFGTNENIVSPRNSPRNYSADNSPRSSTPRLESPRNFGNGNRNRR